uniref:MAT homeobox alpha 2 protein n=1 Tax=Suhomyces bolitotheri TaxID=246028 RepID=A0A3S9NLP0_9ASCO|nr:MAT homeobox alpha 2 protein [Suhomyces bolitotheri]
MNPQSESLKLIELHLKMHITTITTFPIFDPEVIRNEIDKHTLFISTFLERAPYLRDSETQILKRIYLLVNALVLMSEERCNLHREVFKLAEHENLKSYQKDHQFINCDMNSIRTAQHKFTSEQRLILEEWYQDNLEWPYLNSMSTQDLHKRTGLSLVQVKNWSQMMILTSNSRVSNKRRKDKTQKISEELQDILM